MISGNSSSQEQAQPPGVGSQDTRAPAATPVAVKKSTVTLAAFPDTAIAYLDGEPIQLPRSIDVDDGQTVTLEIRADGYVPQTVKLNGSEQRKMVTLAKEEPTKPATSRPRSQRPPPGTPRAQRRRSATLGPQEKPATPPPARARSVPAA
jgi:serine/threonine-protein kinase